MVFNINSLWSY